MIKVLVIDAAAGCYRTIRKLMPPAGITGFKIEFMTSHRGVLEALSCDHYDVCVIDAARGNGPQLFSQARSLGCAAPIVLVTSDDAREAVAAMRSGVADCLFRDDLTAAGVERIICGVVEQARSAVQQRERECRYRALMDNARELIWAHDLDGNLTSMNPPCEQLLAYAREEWSDLAMSQMFDFEYRDAAQQVIQETLDARRKTFSRMVILTKRGEKISVETSSHLIYDEGRAVEIQWIARELNYDRRAFEKAPGDAPIHSSHPRLHLLQV